MMNTLSHEQEHQLRRGRKRHILAIVLFLFGFAVNSFLLVNNISFINEEIINGLKIVFNLLIIHFIFYYAFGKTMYYWMGLYLFYTIADSLILMTINDFSPNDLFIRLLTLSVMYYFVKRKDEKSN